MIQKNKQIFIINILLGIFILLSNSYSFSIIKSSPTDLFNGEKLGPNVFLNESEIDNFLINSVFIGDSVTKGFENYCMQRNTSYLSQIKFLTVISLSTNICLHPDWTKIPYPLYLGKRYPIWESINLMQAKNTFICLGVNDLESFTIEETFIYYKELIDKIKSFAPDTNIHLITMTGAYKGVSVYKLNRENIKIFNDTLKVFAKENEVGFIDVYSKLIDENGDLKGIYSTDKYVHLSDSAYEIILNTLRDYIRKVPNDIQ
ncbi:MAG: SGNH/GDSL hydrolase family protein [Eubacteriales bacterium]|nr:SGNH/GDSL hydrolase family protein [Eubacteriales bacterium]